jgi:hypothetical protein
MDFVESLMDFVESLMDFVESLMDFVESLMETLNRSWGLFAHRASAPAALMIPPIAITPDKAENNTQKEEGVRGMLPTCCLPFGEERG